MNNLLLHSWNRLWLALDAQGDDHALMQALLTAYGEPQRKYHTLQHLQECLALFDQHLPVAAHPGEVEAAIWFHDAVYDVTAHDNEAKSAEWAAQALASAGVSQDHIVRIQDLIMATRHSTLPQGQDQIFLVDIDLAILGASRTRFAEYEAQIRSEYGWVPDPLFCSKRHEILSGFLSRSTLYHTPALHDLLEKQARANLAHALQALEH